MAERGNDAHRRILSHFTAMDEATRRWCDRFCSDRGNSIPPATLRETTNPYHSDDEEDGAGEFIEDPTTSGRIYPKDAIYFIFRFAASLGSRRDKDNLLPLFIFEETQLGNRRSHTCVVNLPASPIHAISASHHSSKFLAKRAACYQACLELYRRGFLDSRLYPLPASATASREREWEGVSTGRVIEDNNHSTILSHSENKAIVSHCYRIKKPDFWRNTLSTPVASWYPTAIMTTRHTDALRPYAPMTILARRPLPELHSFKIFISGVSADVRFRACAETQLTGKQVQDLYLYTIRICRAVANKPFSCSYESMAYLFAPLTLSWEDTTQDPWNLPDILDYIPWDVVSTAAQSWVTELPADDIDQLTRVLEDAIIQDRTVEFTRRYDIIKLRTDLNPLSTPFDSPVSSCFA